MSRMNRWRSVTAGIAPLMVAILSSGPVAAGHGSLACDDCPSIGPYSVAQPYQAYPSSPIFSEPVPGDVIGQPPEAFSPPVEMFPSTAAPNIDPASIFATNFGGGGASALAFADGPVGGYIDPAIVRTQARFRFDGAYGINRPDRAEYMYSTWQRFGGENPNPPEGFPDPDVDRQTLWFYYEHAFGQDDDISLFVNLPVVFSDPLRNPNDQGVGDLQAGFKLSLYESRCHRVTFQLNNYIPTAKASELWLGTGHYSIEPGLLLWNRFGKAWTVEAEICDWIPIDGAFNPENQKNYAGNVLRYGVGVGYDLAHIYGRTITPVVECVGWSVLGGQVFEFNDALVDQTNTNLAIGNVGPRSASGDTIVNLKLGTRIANTRGGSIYAGWGHSLTGDRWYEDIVRFEFRKLF